MFGYLNSHNYVEEKLVFLRTSTPVGTCTLSSWDFRNILHGVSTVFVVSVFDILGLVFLLQKNDAFSKAPGKQPTKPVSHETLLYPVLEQPSKHKGRSVRPVAF